MSSVGTGTAETSGAMGRVLLVCDDSASIQQLTEGMQQLAIATEVCVDVRMALGLLSRKMRVDIGAALPGYLPRPGDWHEGQALPVAGHQMKPCPDLLDEVQVGRRVALEHCAGAHVHVSRISL